jgi:adenosylmethionine-8-amino-7-oxononanoate aminotransferase
MFLFGPWAKHERSGANQGLEKMSHVLNRTTAGAYPVVAAASGMEIIDAQGRRYIDGSGGAAVSCLGHGHPYVLAAMRAQMERVVYSHTSFFTSEPAEALAAELVRGAPPGLSKVYFTSGGSEAIESSLKLARQYFLEIGQTRRCQVIARRQSYHGNTLGALAAGGNAPRRKPFSPLLIETHHVSPCFAYHGQGPHETAREYGLRLAGELERKILELGADTVMAFVAETVVGATAGAVVPVENYFRAVRDICDRHGVLLILDEVMCGMGRTGTLHACEQEGVRPDLLTIAKGLGGGYAPIGAMLVSQSIFDALDRGSGAFNHGYTYNGHPLACSAALAVQEVIRRDDLLANVRVQGERLKSRLTDRFGDNPHIGDIRGRGLLQAVELVADRERKAPFDPQLKVHARIKAQAMTRGLIVYPMGGTIDGKEGDHVLLAPPFISSAGDIDAIVDRLSDAVHAVLQDIGPQRASSRPPRSRTQT